MHRRLTIIVDDGGAGVRVELMEEHSVVFVLEADRETVSRHVREEVIAWCDRMIRKEASRG